MTASNELRQQYLDYLKRYGLEPRSVPPDAVRLRQSSLQAMLEDARRRGDNVGAELMNAAAPKSMAASLDLHPSEIILERLRASVEEAISRHQKYNRSFSGNVYVGEFPTGSFNAEVTRVRNGFLVLVNSGLLVLIKQVYEALNLVDDLSRARESEEMVSKLAAVAVSYLHFGNSIYGPLPISGGLKAILVGRLCNACQRFVVAHEYGHLLSGHLGQASSTVGTLASKAGEIEVIRKNWDEEFEADRVAHELLLGTAEPSILDLSVIDRAMSEDDSRVMAAAIDLKCELVAPLLFFAVEDLINTTWLEIQHLDPDVLLSTTHPPTQQRLEKVRERLQRVPMKYLGYASFPATLYAMAEGIAKRAKALVRNGFSP